ncbi:MAG: hypothetical protein JKX98_01665 [Alcanivoracaceae bacterium]|nr:hypothetical protein [Alcanivoracaceae bacterium]
MIKNSTIKIYLFLSLLIFVLNVHSQVNEKIKPFELTIAVNEALGVTLSQQDWAAEVGTDAIIRLGADLSNKKIKAFIVEIKEQSWLLSFIGKKKVSLGIYYQIEIDSNGPKDETYIKLPKPMKLSKQQKLIFKATELAKKQEFLRCTNSYNNVALSVFGEDGLQKFYIYMLAATNKAGVNIGGGHHRFLIDPKKNKVIEDYAHTKDCLIDTLSKETTALVFTHITSEVPNEFHVYMSYLYNLPIYIFTTNNKIIWKVFDGKIVPIDFPNKDNINASLQDRMKNI